MQVVLTSDVEQRLVGIQANVDAAIRATVASMKNQRLRYVDVEKAFGGATGHTVSCGDTRSS
jgi:hypothetical protein